MIRFFLGIICLIASFQLLANNLTTFKQEISFSHFQSEVEYLKQDYLCNFDKLSNPYYQFTYVALNIESSIEEDLSKYQSLSKSSRKLIEDKALSKEPVTGTLPEIICIKGASAFVLHKFIWFNNSKQQYIGGAYVARYDYLIEGKEIKLKAHENESISYQVALSETVESKLFFDIKLNNP